MGMFQRNLHLVRPGETKKYKKIIGTSLLGAAVLAGTFFAGRGSMTDYDEHTEKTLYEERLNADRRAKQYADEIVHLDPLDSHYQEKYMLLRERHDQAEKDVAHINRTLEILGDRRAFTRAFR